MNKYNFSFKVDSSNDIVHNEEMSAIIPDLNQSPHTFPTLPDHWTSEIIPIQSADAQARLHSVLHTAKDWKGPHRLLVILHGLGEHSGRYHHFPHYLQNHMSGVYYLDHQGHGRSEGRRGHISHFDNFAHDAAQAVQKILTLLQKRSGHPTEVHLLGHSMGGLIALRTLFLHPTLPFSSATVCAALLGIRVPIPFVKKQIALLLAKLYDRIQLKTTLDTRHLSHDLATIHAYETDLLIHNKMTPRFFLELQATMNDTLHRTSGISVPTQFFVPLADQIVDPETQIRFYHQLNLSDKHLITYPDLFHEPFNEVGKEQVFEDLLKWIKSHSIQMSRSSD